MTSHENRQQLKSLSIKQKQEEEKPISWGVIHHIAKIFSFLSDWKISAGNYIQSLLFYKFESLRFYICLSVFIN